jgi:hypothetical protein
MNIRTKIALAAVVASSFAVPVTAGEWVYHGGPKGPDSLRTYEPYDYAYDGGSYAGPRDGYGYRYVSPETDY